MIKQIEVSLNCMTAENFQVGKKHEITLSIPKEMGECTRARMFFNRWGEEPKIIVEMRQTQENNFLGEVTLPQLGNYYLHFMVQINGREMAVKINRETHMPFLTNEESPYWRILAIQKKPIIPEWANGEATVYQLFVDRFFEGKNVLEKIPGRNYRNWGEMPNHKRNSEGKFHNNDFFRGNISGITEKLSYFKKLGVTVLYLSPIFFSKYRYDGYAATDFTMVDPDKGTLMDLKELHEKANAMGIHVILDVAFNHCNSDNPIFQEALKNPNSPYRSWFYFNADGSYKYWYDLFKDMPIFNQSNPAVQEYFAGENGIVAKFGEFVDGFRFDVSEELKYEFLSKIYEKDARKSEHLFIGEAWNKVPLERLGTCIDGMTDYPFTDMMYKWILEGNFDYFQAKLKDVLENYPEETICCSLNSIDTHDTVRALTILRGKWMRKDREVWKIDEYPSKWHIFKNGRIVFLTDEFREDEAQSDVLEPQLLRKAVEDYKILTLLQFTLPGIPCIYYGTEVGSHGYKDPFNRKCFPWERINKKTFHHTRRLSKARMANIEHLKGSYCNIFAGNQNILGYERNGAIVIFNRDEQEHQITVPKEYENATVVFKTYKGEMQKQGNMITLPRKAGAILVK